MLNPKLKSFSRFVGEWTTVGTHRLISGTILHGHVSFKWIEDGAYLLMRSEVKEEGIPSATAIFGGDDKSEIISMLYFDERGVSRIFETTLEGKNLENVAKRPRFFTTLYRHVCRR